MKTLSQFLTSQVLSPFLDKAKTLEKLSATWSIVMREWTNHCVIANFEKGHLVLQVQNAAWATRVRYAIPEMIKTLSGHSEFASIKTIQCKVGLPVRSREPSEVIRARSSLACECLDEAAKNTDHAELKASLMRLSENMKRIT